MLCFLVGGQECTLGDCGGARKLHLVIFVGPGNYVIGVAQGALCEVIVGPGNSTLHACWG